MDKGLMSGSTTMLVLSLLSRKDMYGYEMISELQVRSDETFVLKEGTLYPILHGLEKKGMVECYIGESDKKRKRKYYHLTRKGGNYLKDKEKEWTLFKGKVDQVLGGEVHA